MSVHDDSESSESERELDKDLIVRVPEIKDENLEVPQSNRSLDIAVPIVDLPISCDGITAQDLIVPTSEEFEKTQKEDTQLKILRTWIEENRSFSENYLAPFSSRLKSLAQMIDQFSLHEKFIVLRRPDDPVGELIVVPSTLKERIIRFFHEGPGRAHQASKATSAKILRSF